MEIIFRTVCFALVIATDYELLSGTVKAIIKYALKIWVVPHVTGVTRLLHYQNVILKI